MTELVRPSTLIRMVTRFALSEGWPVKDNSGRVEVEVRAAGVGTAWAATTTTTAARCAGGAAAVEQLRQEIGGQHRIRSLEREDVDVGLGDGGNVEIPDHCQNQIHRLGRSGNDQAVGADVRGQVNILDISGLNSPPLAVSTQKT